MSLCVCVYVYVYLSEVHMCVRVCWPFVIASRCAFREAAQASTAHQSKHRPLGTPEALLMSEASMFQMKLSVPLKPEHC